MILAGNESIGAGQLEIKQVTPEFFVAPQMAAGDVGIAAGHGIKAIICNRPDGEAGPDQPASDDVAAAARALGIEFISIPFTAGKQTAEDIAQFREALADLPGPVLAYCRTGSRSSQIWAMARIDSKQSVQETVDIAAAAGIDLRKLRPVLDHIADQLGGA